MSINRRKFLKGAVGIGFAGLGAYFVYNKFKNGYKNQIKGYGNLIKDPDGIFDLPEKFSYKILSRVGDIMDDGFPLPGLPDGMATFPGSNGKVILVRNHELGFNNGNISAFGENEEYLKLVPKSKIYDFGQSGKRGFGGTTTIVYDIKKGEVEKQYLSLCGTLRNCSGGPTPWGSWLTCEETEEKAGEELKKDHGYVFEVPASENIGLIDPTPLIEMGRIYREAAAIDPNSGTVYLTEDKSDGLFYRYIPNTPGQLHEGGKLQALAIKGKFSADLTNWVKPFATTGVSMDVEWIDMEDIDNPNNDLRERGHKKGAAIFARGEGLWFGDKELFIACTSGGVKKLGQGWRYIPSDFEGKEEEKNFPGKIELFIEPNENNLLERCDNITISPWGHLFVCEDGSGEDYVKAITPNGEIYTIGRNALSFSETAGVCFSPDGSTMFLNIQAEGLTIAITGPWGNIKT